MKYAQHLEQNLPLGSGVTAAACKTIVKQRLCCSGMKWQQAGAAVVLSLRTLSHRSGRWEQFWSNSTNMDFCRLICHSGPIFTSNYGLNPFLFI